MSSAILIKKAYFLWASVKIEIGEIVSPWEKYLEIWTKFEDSVWAGSGYLKMGIASLKTYSPIALTVASEATKEVAVTVALENTISPVKELMYSFPEAERVVVPSSISNFK